MINKFVEKLTTDGLVTYINELTGVTVKLGARNIADFQIEDDDLDGDTLIITIIRIDEESTLKNFPNQRLVEKGGAYKIDKRFPKIFLNYYLLFSCTLQYDKAVAIIHRLIKFFQQQKKFEFEADEDNLELNMELCSPSFEQLNNIWGMLGGKQLPSIIYKARVTAIERDIENMREVITSVGGTIKHYE